MSYDALIMPVPDDIDSLQKRIAELEEALKIYANNDNWVCRTGDSNDPNSKDTFEWRGSPNLPSIPARRVLESEP